VIVLSEQMTNGRKWDMFVLDFSFIGWFLLGALAFFVGTVFVYPYVSATQSELYLVLKQNAMQAGNLYWNSGAMLRCDLPAKCLH